LIIIKHRINRINQIKNTSTNYGVEIDLRSDLKTIYLHHEPYKKGVKFTQWIKEYNHKILVLNVKEEGLENKIIKVLKKNKISNFFFHDQTFSTLLKNRNKTKVSIRYSEFEDLKNEVYLFKKIKWIWIDHFSKFPMNKKSYNIFKKNNVKICVVSPELVNINLKKKIKYFKEYLKKNKFKIDAVCTKFPELWKDF
tara:strand:+ start:7742 stop:8329 length:588 start_codon:yes stop_codon:yes gene_type:complete